MSHGKPNRDQTQLETRRPIRRRDATGHLDPEYASQLALQTEKSASEQSTEAFLRSPRSQDPLAEELGETFIRAATSGQDEYEILEDEPVPEDIGGPFVESSSSQEFASGTDESNPESAEPEPFPTT